MVRLLKAFPNIDGHERAKSLLKKHITSVNISADIEYLKIHPSWERPYGWAWLLKLMQEIHTWDDPEAEGLGLALKPLAEELSAMYISHLPKLVYPIRVGEHTNTAFGLTFAWDYAVHFEDAALVDAIRDRARTFYLEDKECPLAWCRLCFVNLRWCYSSPVRKQVAVHSCHWIRKYVVKYCLLWLTSWGRGCIKLARASQSNNLMYRLLALVRWLTRSLSPYPLLRFSSEVRPEFSTHCVV
jgi:hypothetical protein